MSIKSLLVQKQSVVLLTEVCPILKRVRYKSYVLKLWAARSTTTYGKWNSHCAQYVTVRKHKNEYSD